MIKHIIIFAILLACNLSPAQKCNKLKEWTNVVLKEFPERNLDKHDYAFVKRVAFNLFSDEYFEPYFKKPFDKLYKMQQTGFEKRFEKCKNKDGLTWQANNSLLSYFRDNFGETTKMVLEARKLNNEYNELKNEILQSDISTLDLNKFLNPLRFKYKLLFPSKTDSLINLLTREQEKRKSNTEASRINSIILSINNASTLDKISTIKSGNEWFLSKLSNEQKNIVNQAIQDQTNKVLEVELTAILKAQKSKQYSLYQDIKVIDAESSAFFVKYFDYRLGVDLFEEIIALYKKQHLEVLIANKNEILKRINKSRTKYQLKYIETEYLNFDDKAKYIYYDYFDDTEDKKRFLNFKEALLNEIKRRKDELKI